MNILLDTHYILWLLFDDKKISKSMKKIFSDPSNNFFVSAISMWEISLKHSIKKLDLLDSNPKEIYLELISLGIEFIDLNSKDASTCDRLPQDKNADPFDRMLIWQAISNDL